MIARLSWRVADMTGLSLQSAEMLQVANYGIGGQFEPHYDYGQVIVDFSSKYICNMYYHPSKLSTTLGSLQIYRRGIGR